MVNKIHSLLCDMGICDNESIRPFFPRVRDREDVSAMKCQKSGVIFLSCTEHAHPSCYETKQGFQYWGTEDRKSALRDGHADSARRFRQFGDVVAGKKWIDVGTGAGGMLDLLSPLASEAMAVEPQESVRNALVKLGYNVWRSVDEIPHDDIEVVTLFHVFEHLVDPLQTLETLGDKMSHEARIIIEVPHARDFLISYLDLDEFKSFTLWSEHLILHTRNSLRVFLEKSGFTNVSIRSYQRYPLANHLHWLARGEPGGHVKWNHLRTPTLDMAYSDMLAQIDCTDTLIATATKSKS